MIKQGLEQKLQQRLSPLQIQTIKILELPALDMEQRIRTELEENPVLDESSIDADDSRELSLDELKEDDYIPSYRTRVRNWGPDEKPQYDTLSVKESFTQSLINQLGFRDLDQHQRDVAMFIIGSLDEDGYLRRDLESIVDDLAFRANVTTDYEEVESMLNMIQEFEPAGIGARDVRECLLLQLKASRRTPDVENAVRILEEEFQNFSGRHFQKIMSRLGLSQEELKAAMDRIIKLNPAPGGQINDSYDDNAQQVVPDFVITDDDGELEFTMPRYSIPELRVNRKYADLLLESRNSGEKAQKEAATFVRQKLDSAKWFIEAVRQRHNTLTKVMKAIMDTQRDYFLSGDETDIKPMVLKDIADITGFDISTISRAVNGKYVETPFGIFPLKYFFSEGLENLEGEEVSTRELKKVLRDCIDAEDKKKPLTDEQLVEQLGEKGYKVARRTIAKYRAQLGIPLARWRKEL